MSTSSIIFDLRWGEALDVDWCVSINYPEVSEDT